MSLVRAILALVIVPMLAAPPDPAAAQPIVVVGNDRGGHVNARAQEVDRLSAERAEVRIEGRVCFSSCTMYLGAGDVCVSPATTFGFHGPSDFGEPLPPERFDHWSRVMARYYREPVRSWFMNTARYETRDIARVSGAQLIRLGYPSC